MGDGNVHLNVLPPNTLDRGEIDARIYKAKNIINDVLDNYRGSMSAEHGIGRLKRPDFEKRLPDVQRQLLSAIKTAIDPSLAMNPGCQLSLLSYSGTSN